MLYFSGGLQCMRFIGAIVELLAGELHELIVCVFEDYRKHCKVLDGAGEGSPSGQEHLEVCELQVFRIFFVLTAGYYLPTFTTSDGDFFGN